MFNGISKAFEIKTILDKEYRLSNQIEEYKKIFNEVYIIIPKVLLSKYIDFDKNIGIITYESNSKIFKLEREPKSNSKIDIDVLMNTIHSKEYLGISKSYYKQLPEMNSFNQLKFAKNSYRKYQVKN